MIFRPVVGLSGMTTEVWSLVHGERAALIEDLARLEDAQWDLPSLCVGWTVHDVVAHLVDVARTTRLGFALDMARARLDFDRQNARGVRRARAATPHETLERLRDAAPRTSSPPAPIDTRIVEEVVHGEDIRRPLGVTRTYPQVAVVRSLLQQARTSASFGGARELLETVHLTATDADVSVGDGAEVKGPVLALLLAASGRSVALGELSGPGLRHLTDWVGVTL